MSRILILIATLTLSGLAASAQAIELGSIADSRFATSWTLDGGSMTQTRVKLLDPANFGPAGTVVPAINITDTAAAIDAALLANLDVFFIGYLDDANVNAFTGAELAAFQTWVNGGGSMLITCDDANFDAVCSFFGHPANDPGASPGTPTVAGVAHPLFNGPFGTVPSFVTAGTIGFFTSAAGATILANEASGPSPNVLVRTVGSGTLVLMSDVCIIANVTLTAGTGITNNNDVLMGNAFAFVASASATGVPEPIPTLAEWGIILMTMLLVFFAIRSLRQPARNAI